MQGKFSLSIDLGNEAMSEVEHIVTALGQVAERFGDGMEQDGRVRDANGNTVGRFALELASSEPYVSRKSVA